MDIDLLHLLHDGIVDRYILAFRIEPVNFLLFVGCGIDGCEALEDTVDCRGIEAECVDDGLDAPYEYASIPEIVVLADVSCCRLLVRFLSERLDREYLLVAHSGSGQVSLYISIACLWA